MAYQTSGLVDCLWLFFMHVSVGGGRAEKAWGNDKQQQQQGTTGQRPREIIK